jgi:hypothetical protein
VARGFVTSPFSMKKAQPKMILALTSFETWVGFVDHIYAPFAADNPTIFVTGFQGLK